MMPHVAALRRDVAAYQHWQLLNSQAVKDIWDRVDKAYQAFFKKLKAGKAKPYKRQSAWSLRKYGILRKGQPKFRGVKDHCSFALPMGNGCQLLESDNPKIGKLRLAFGWRGAETITVRYHIGGRSLPDKVKSVHHHAHWQWQVLVGLRGRAEAAPDSPSQHGQDRRV